MTATTQMHFNPRSHEGSDANARERARRQNISIHAPTRGATIKKLPKRDQSSDFNPRSHEGSDIEGGVGVGVTSDFNPRSHEGSDDVKPWVDGWSDTFQSTLPRGERLEYETSFWTGNKISIHAPTRGATLMELRKDLTLKNFNPRSHEGSDSWTHLNNTWFGYFNPRSHEGSDGLETKKYSNYNNFNPRSHEGSDAQLAQCCCDTSISIHAPTRGATRNICTTYLKFWISIHAPTRGATAAAL